MTDLKLAIWGLRAHRLVRRYERKDPRADIGRAIELYRRARDAAPPGTFTRALFARSVGEGLDIFSSRTGDQNALAEGVQAVREAIDTIPASDYSRPILQRALMELLSRRFPDNIAALEEAADIGRELIDENAPAGGDIARELELLGRTLHSLFLLTSDPEISAEALRVTRSATRIWQIRGDPVVISIAAIQLRDLFAATGDTEVLLESVQTSRTAIARARKKSDRAICLNNLALMLLDLAQITGDTDPLEEAVQVARESLALMRSGDPNRAGALCNLGTGLRCLSQITGDLDTITAAVRPAREAVVMTKPGDPMLYMRLVMLQGTLVRLLQATGDPEILREAEEVEAKALGAISARHPDNVSVLLSHTTIVQDMAAWSGDRALLLNAVKVGRRAVAAAPAGHALRSMTLVSLGQALIILAERDADLAMSTEAAQVLRDALAILPPQHHELSDALSPLGLALRQIWRLTGDREILAEAVETGRMAVASAAASPEQPRRARCLANLGISLLELYDAIPAESLNDEIVQTLRDAVLACPPGDPLYAAYLSNLCLILQQVSVDPQDPAIAREAVEAGRAAVAATPPNHPDRPRQLASLGRALLNLAELTQDQEVAAEAARTSREAVTAVRDENFAVGNVRFLAGRTYCGYYELTGDLAVLTEAKHVLAEAVRVPTLTPGDRMSAFRLIATSALITGHSQSALAACEQAVAVLPQLATRRLSRVDREHALGSIFQFPAEVAAAATAAGHPERAIELLEQTRGLLIGEALDADGSLANLQSLAPDLATHFTRLRDRLDAVDRVGLERGFQPTADERARLGQEWDDLLAAIRQCPGLEDFMRPRSIERLAEQAKEGPVVLLYSTELRSDALILQAIPGSYVRVIPLTGVSRSDVTAQNGKLVAALEDVASCQLVQRQAGEQKIRDVLAWLWDYVTGPVIKALESSPALGSRATQSRVWWCPVGELAFMPLHAAGHYPKQIGDVRAEATRNEDTRNTVLDHVISSYTPTIRSLEHARRRTASHRDDPPAALVVAMPHTPSAPSLPGATAEAALVAERIRNSLVLTGPEATSEAVKAAITKYQIAHFACHGISVGLDPGSSRLLLHDHESQPFTVSAISRLRPQNAVLAFLSACSTTVSNERLADEAVHITSAFQLAGYGKVIGTLWPIRDHVAIKMGNEVYRLMAADYSGHVRLDESAFAVHAAIGQLRERYATSPSVWAAFIHVGA